MITVSTRIALSLVLTAATLSACSSGRDDGTGSTSPSPASGTPANTGLPGAPLGGAATTTPRPGTIDLDYLTGENGRSFAVDLGESGWSREFRGLGDIDGDGADDFMFSTTEWTRIVFGSGSRLPETLDPAAPDGVRGLVFEQDLSSLVGIGDVDGDGIDDLAWIVYDERSDGLSARVVFGRDDGGLAALPSLPADGRQGFTIVNGARPIDIRSIAAAGDTDGDGRGDILVGGFAYNGEDFDAPNAWLIHGRDDGFPATVDVARLDATEGLSLTTPLDAAQRASVNDDIGTGYDARVVGDFDFDGDGLADVAIGASRFDWLGQRGALRTYVVLGRAPRRTGSLDMTTLTGDDGVIIAGAWHPHGAHVDGVASLGDVDGDGIDDLAVFDAVNPGAGAHVILGGGDGTGAVIERDALPAGAGFAIGNPSGASAVRALARVGDLDGDGVHDVGIEYHRRGAAILYGGATPRSAAATLDPGDPGTADVSTLDGGDGGDLVALGDIDGDGVDDLGIGWSRREYDAGLVGIGDIDGDGVADIELGRSAMAGLNLLRVLYGVGPEGFTGALPDPTSPRPLLRVERGYHAELLAAVELAARAPLDYLNTALAGGTPLGPAATACLAGSDGVDTAEVTGFVCDAGAPLPLLYDWRGRHVGTLTAGARYAHVALGADGVRTIDYRSFSLAASAPYGGNPFEANFTLERGDEPDGRLVLSGGAPDATGVSSCVVATASRIATGEDDACRWLIDGHLHSLNAVFGSERQVSNLRFEPDPGS